jgi:hypothetical protein
MAQNPGLIIDQILHKPLNIRLMAQNIRVMAQAICVHPWLIMRHMEKEKSGEEPIDASI